MALALKYATANQLAAAFKERLRDSTGLEAARLARIVIRLIADGTYTETQIRTALGLTAVQWNAAKTRFQDYKDKLDALDTATGV